MATETSARHLHFWSGIIVLGIFLAGAATGAGVVLWLRPHRSRPPSFRGMGVILAQLNLSPDQQRKTQSILDKHHAKVEAMMKESFPRVRAEQDQTDRELRAILTDEQAKRFDELRAQRPPPRGRGPFMPHDFGPPPGNRPPPGSPPSDGPPPEPPR